LFRTGSLKGPESALRGFCSVGERHSVERRFGRPQLLRCSAPFYWQPPGAEPSVAGGPALHGCWVCLSGRPAEPAGAIADV